MRSACTWLEAATPAPPARLCIVHGDYRTGNLLYDRRGITGVLDWEMAHPGDPLEDVAWAQLASWRVGTGLVGALLTDDEWIGAYQTASGRSIDPATSGSGKCSPE
jgi:aminoglycoside phosphotransferase (APT) family kinase protein